MFTLARETGWSEHFILWELPFPRALQYYHCALRASLAWTVKPGPAPAQQIEHMKALGALLPAWEEDDEG